MKDLKNLSNDTVLRIRVPKNLYESISKELKKKKLKENMEESAPVEEALGAEDAWIVPLIASAGLAAGMAKNVMAKMKDQNLKGLSGLIKAVSEVAQETRGAIDRSKGGMD